MKLKAGDWYQIGGTGIKFMVPGNLVLFHLTKEIFFINMEPVPGK